jgi:FkbM family methyltransferase
MTQSCNPRSAIRRAAQTASAVRREIAWATRTLNSGRAGFTLDTVLFRALRLLRHLPCDNTARTLVTNDGIRISYRRNRGDIQSIREVFIDCAYTLPSGVAPETLVDLGGNIGLTTLWLARRYPTITRAIVVEPSVANCELARRNLNDNGLIAEVLMAAVAPVSGTAQFAPSRSSNLGRVVNHQRGRTVTVNTITMHEVLDRVGGHIDLLKMDIEGGEQDLLTRGDLSWLDAVDCVVAEFHPTIVDYQKLVGKIADHNFHFHPAGSLRTGSMDCFVRNGVSQQLSYGDA